MTTSVRSSLFLFRSLSVLSVAVIVYLGLRSSGFYFPHLEMSRAQAIVFPFFAVAVYLLSLYVSPLPKWIIPMACAAGFVGLLVVYNYHSFGKRNFLVSVLSGDEYASDTRVFRKTIESRIGTRNEVSIKQLYEPIGSHDEASRMLRNDPRLAGILWGNEKWLTISLHPEAPISELGIISDSIAQEFKNLKIVEDIPAFGISLKPERETGLFLSFLLDANELGYMSASKVIGGWSSYNHRAYPLLRAGNYYLKSSIASGTYQYGEMDCALYAYKTAGKFLRRSSNPELGYAILNNRATALLIKGVVEKRRSDIKRARKTLSWMVKQGPKANPYRTSFLSREAARSNLQATVGGIFKSVGKQKGHKKRKHDNP